MPRSRIDCVPFFCVHCIWPVPCMNAWHDDDSANARRRSNRAMQRASDQLDASFDACGTKTKPLSSAPFGWQHSPLAMQMHNLFMSLQMPRSDDLPPAIAPSRSSISEPSKTCSSMFSPSIVHSDWHVCVGWRSEVATLVGLPMLSEMSRQLIATETWVASFFVHSEKWRQNRGRAAVVVAAVYLRFGASPKLPH